MAPREQGPQGVVTIMAGNDAGKEYFLRNEVTVVGRGLDCDLVPGDRCQPDVRGLFTTDLCDSQRNPYNDVREYGRHLPTQTFALYRAAPSPEVSCRLPMPRQVPPLDPTALPDTSKLPPGVQERIDRVTSHIKTSR